MSPSPYEVRLIGGKYYLCIVRTGVTRLLPSYATEAEAVAEKELREERRRDILAAVEKAVSR